MADNYSVVSSDALDLIDSQPIKRRRRLVQMCVLTLLSMNAGDGNISRWGGKACASRLDIGERTARDALAALEAMTFADGEPILERVGKHRVFDLRRPTKRNPIITPHKIRDLLPWMFRGEDRFPEKAERLMLMLKVYATHDERAMCCHKLWCEGVEAEEYADELMYAMAPTTIPGISDAWGFPQDDPAIREERGRRTVAWLANAGLISIVRIVVNGQAFSHVADYGSGYWRKKTGSYQLRIRDYAGDEPFAGVDDDAEYPVFFMGGELCSSIMPQYVAMTGKRKRCMQEDIELRDELLEELADYE